VLWNDSGEDVRLGLLGNISVLCMVVLPCFENDAGRLCLLALSWRALPDVVSVVGDHLLPLRFFYICQDTILPVYCAL
jgi:hypothetical protein